MSFAEKVYATTAHEVFHAITDKLELEGTRGLEYYDGEKMKGAALEEHRSV